MVTGALGRKADRKDFFFNPVCETVVWSLMSRCNMSKKKNPGLIDRGMVTKVC